MNKVINQKTAVVFNVEKVKNQKIPMHFFATKDVKFIKVNGVKVKFMRNVEKTQYVAFEIDDVKYYIRDHKVMDCSSLESYEKPKVVKPEVKKRVKQHSTLVDANENAIMNA